MDYLVDMIIGVIIGIVIYDTWLKIPGQSSVKPKDNLKDGLIESQGRLIKAQRELISFLKGD